MVLQYTVCDCDIPNPGNFPYPRFLHIFLHILILGLPQSGEFSYPGKFPYPVKYSILKYAYLF